jgi:uncharacterized protein (DUF2141 family)
MRKLSLIFMAVLVAALAGCAGDTQGPGGTLATVQDLQLDATSAGRTIVLVWSAVTDEIDGYEVYFKTDGTGNWEKVGDSATATYTHTATNAGTYSVRAYKDTNFSENYSTEVSTMPTVISASYTIVDNNAPEDMPSGFIFGATQGTPGMASQPGFVQDIYAYDDEFKGDTNISLYSGNKGTFGNGRQSYFQVPLGNGYCDPTGTWYNTSYKLMSGDSVVFIGLTDGSAINGYAKMYGLSIAGSSTEHGTELTFRYEIQVGQQGAGYLTVFTSSIN